MNLIDIVYIERIRAAAPDLAAYVKNVIQERDELLIEVADLKFHATNLTEHERNTSLGFYGVYPKGDKEG